jgi:hypothetical protein
MKTTTILPTLLALTLLGTTGTALAFDTEMLLQSGDSGNRLDLVILGDGYRAQDQAQMTTDAQALVAALFAEDVFGRYRNYFNIKLVHVESNDNGADRGDYGDVRDTALGSYFFCQNTERLLCADSGLVMAAAMADAPEHDQIIVMVNDTKYGGAGGTFATTSIAPGSSDVAVHELGHSLFNLADEYDSAVSGWTPCDPVADCPEPNATVFSTFADIKWNHWILPTTPLPTPAVPANDALIGAFEGVRYFTTGQYRPLNSCLMRDLGRTFCSVCAEQGVLSTYRFAGLVDSVSPAAPVSFSTAQTQQFRVDGPVPVPNTLSFVWSVDGNPIATTPTGVLNLSGATIAPGPHTLTVAMQDLTPLVREDPANELIDSRSWSFTVTAAPGNWRTFEDPARPWTTVFPFSVTSNPDASHGAASEQVNGCFYTPVFSPLFNTTELGAVGTRLAMDIKLPLVQPIPVWNGTIIVTVTVPGAFLFNVPVGSVTLLGTPLNQWRTVSVNIPWIVRQALAGNHNNAQLTIAITNANCLAPMLIDNVRYQ